MQAQRQVPTTRERAVTELLRCRRHLQLSRECLETSIGVLRRLDQGDAPAISIPGLEAILGDFEALEMSLHMAIPADRTPERQPFPG